MKILFIEQNTEIRQLYSIFIQSHFENVEVFESSSLAHSIEVIETMENIDLIIFDNLFSDGYGIQLINYLTKNKYQMPLLFFSEDDPKDCDGLENILKLNPKNRYLAKPTKPDEFRKYISDYILQSEALRPQEVKYYSFATVNLFRFNKSKCDIFIKLSEKKYIKVINKGENYSKQFIEKLIGKGVRSVYIFEDDYLQYNDDFLDFPFLEHDREALGNQELEDQVVTKQKSLHRIVQEVGFTEEAIKLAEDNVSRVESIVGSGQVLSSLLNQAREREDYVYEHSYIVAVIASKMAKDLEGDAVKARRKLISAALLHDITLEKPEHAMIDSLADDKISKFSKKEIEIIKNHPEKTAKLVEFSGGFTKDIVDIILHHHEDPKQTGFPKQIHPNLFSELDCIFIVAHKYVSLLYRYHFDPEKEDKIKIELKANFRSGFFRDCLQVLLKELERNKQAAA